MTHDGPSADQAAEKEAALQQRCMMCMAVLVLSPMLLKPRVWNTANLHLI